MVEYINIIKEYKKYFIINYVNQDLNNFKILKISNSFYLKLDI